MEFRPARSEDLEFIVNVYNSTITSRMVTADTEAISVEERIEWFKAHSERYPLWIIRVDQIDIGFVSIRPFYGRPAYRNTVEISIYLDEKHRGKGYGKQVLLKGISLCKKLGHKNLLGFIFEHNLASIALFKKCGFKEWGLLPGIAEMDGHHYSLSIMGLKIT